MSYIDRHVLLSGLLEDLNKCVGTFTLLLDETATAQAKVYDFLVRYLSETEDEVITRYLTSTLFAHTSADELQKMVIDILESSQVELEKFAYLSTDSLHQRLDKNLQECSTHPGLLPFNPCVLHKTTLNSIMAY